MNAKGVVVSVIVLLTLACPAWAETDRYWITPYFESWVDGQNWNTSTDGSGESGVPEEGDRVFFNQGEAIVPLNQDIPHLQEISMSGASSLRAYAGSYLESDAVTIDLGWMSTLGRQIVKGDMTLGQNVKGYGFYDLLKPSSTYSSSLSSTNLLIGGSGYGKFVQHAGTVTVDTELTLGRDAGGEGYYYLSEGTLIKQQYETKIGDAGYGYFHQSGGTFKLNGFMYLGDDTYVENNDGFHDGYGKYVMTGGSIEGVETGDIDGNGDPIFSYGNIVLGEWGGKGFFVQDGGIVDIQSLTLGRQENSFGEYELHHAKGNDDQYTPDLGVYGDTVVGNKGIGSFINTSGKHFVKNSLTLGLEESALGLYEMHTGSLLWTDTTIVGKSGAGVFSQYDGKHFVGVDLDGKITNENSLLEIGALGEYLLAGGSLQVGGKIVNSGKFTGRGDVSAPVFENSGVLAPGTSPGILTLGGNFIQTPGGSLEIELGTAGWDQLIVEGEAKIAGDLYVSFWESFVPTTGMTFEFLKAGLGGVGKFGNIFGPTGWIWELQYVDLPNANTNGWDEVWLVARGPVATPEPTTALLLGSGLLALLGLGRRK